MKRRRGVMRAGGLLVAGMAFFSFRAYTDGQLRSRREAIGREVLRFAEGNCQALSPSFHARSAVPSDAEGAFPAHWDAVCGRERNGSMLETAYLYIDHRNDRLEAISIRQEGRPDMAVAEATSRQSRTRTDREIGILANDLLQRLKEGDGETWTYDHTERSGPLLISHWRSARRTALLFFDNTSGALDHLLFRVK